MRLNAFSKLMILVLWFSSAGCMASFEPRLAPGAMEQSLLPTAAAAQHRVEIGVEEYFSSHKSRRAFDADLGASGVLPILIHVKNQSDRNYRLERRRIEARWVEQPLVPLAGITAAETGALRNPAWYALVNTAAIGPLAMFFGVGTLAASASQTQKINRQIEQYFERMELADRILKPNETAAGFVFFQMPSSDSSLEGLILRIILEPEAADDRDAGSLTYRFVLPPLSRGFGPNAPSASR